MNPDIKSRDFFMFKNIYVGEGYDVEMTKSKQLLLWVWQMSTEKWKNESKL